MEPARAVQRVSFGSIKTIVEESKFTLELKHFQNCFEEFVSAKVKMLNVDAEWWVTVNPKVTEIIETKIYDPAWGVNRTARPSIDFIPLKINLLLNSEDVLESENCKFEVSVTLNGDQVDSTGCKAWREVNKILTYWNPKIKIENVELLDDLELEFFFSIAYEKPSIKNKFHDPVIDYKEIIANYSRMLKTPVLADFTFDVKGKKFEVHKCILGAASPFFSSLFTSNMQEALESLCKVDSFEPETFESILNFIYEAKLPDNFEEEAKDLYEAAHYYGLERLKEICGQEVHSALSIENAVELYCWAFTYDLIGLKNDAWDIVKRDVLKVYFQIKNEPLDPKVLRDVIAYKQNDQKYWKSLKEVKQENENWL